MEVKDLKRQNNFDINRTEFSDIALSVLDALCDIARESGSTMFKHNSVLDIANHFVNFYYVNFFDSISLDYIETNTDIPVTKFKKFVKNRNAIYKDNQGFKVFRHAYSLAIIAEIIASGAVVHTTEPDNSIWVSVKNSILEKTTEVYSQVTHSRQEIHMFGLGLIAKRTYFTNALKVMKITNKNFIVGYENLDLDLPIGILIYIAIAERYGDKESVINTLLNLVDGAVKE